MLTQRAAAHDLFLFSFVESSCEADLAPFYGSDAGPACPCATCATARDEAVRAEAALDAELEAREEAVRAEAALDAERMAWCPAPEIVLTGKIIAVEWEDLDRGGRWWVTMDEGELAFECWQARRCGYGLSDVDEPAQ